MHFPMRIQPIDAVRTDGVKPPVVKSRLKRLFDRPFNSVLKISSADQKQAAGGEKDGGAAAAPPPDFEPSSVCLDKMVQSFIEDNNSNDKQSAAKCARHRCNCFNGNINDSSDDEFGFFSDSLAANSSINDPSDALKSLIPCATMAERNLLAEASKIVENITRNCKRKDDLRNAVNEGLSALGYNASVCKSKWEKSSSIPSGEYEYIDVIVKGERIIVDVDFRSEFEIARSTSLYKATLQCLPTIFVGKSDRLLSILSIATEAARQSLKKKGMHIAPWRKAEYVKSKWLSPYTRLVDEENVNDAVRGEPDANIVPKLDLIFGESKPGVEELKSPSKVPGEAAAWQLPEVKPRSLERVNKTAVVTGLASLLNDKL